MRVVALIPVAVAISLAVVLVSPAQAAIGGWIEPNLGQADAPVQAIARDGDMTLLLESHRVQVLLPRLEAIASGRGGQAVQLTEAWLVEQTLVGACEGVKATWGEPGAGVSRYFRGADPDRWLGSVAHHDSVRFAGVYPGIDLVYRLRGQRLEYDFEAAAGADLSQIRIALEGVEATAIDARGDLVAATAAGEFRQRKPQVFRVDGDRLHPVDGAFRLDGDTFGFVVDRPHPDDKILIDPVIEFSGYLGGSGTDLGRDIGVNSRGNLIVSGETQSVDFPGTAGPLPGDSDLFIAEIDRSTGQLLWVSFLGGSAADHTDEFEFDSNGNIVSVGYTESPDFPTVNAFQDTFVGNEDPLDDDRNYDGLVFKLNDDGSQIVFSTYYGGADLTLPKIGWELIRGLAIDADDHIYAIGQTGAPDFPVTTVFAGRACMENDPQSRSTFVADIAVVEFAPDGERLFATCIGGIARDAGRSIDIGPSGNLYVSGFARSPDLPLSADAFQPTLSSESYYAPFVLKLTPDRDGIEWGTYFGGTRDEFLQEVSVLPDGSVVATGHTWSMDFPVTADALQPALASGFQYDVFVAHLGADGTTLEYGTYFGGSGNDRSWATAVDPAGRVYFAGTTQSRDLALRAPVGPLPDPYFIGAREIASTAAVNDISTSYNSFDGLDVIFVARNGVNELVRQSFNETLTYTSSPIGSLAENSLATAATDDSVVFVNQFAPNTLYALDDTGEPMDGVSFGSASRDSRDAQPVSIAGTFETDVIVANYGSFNEINVDVEGVQGLIPIGRADGNTVAVATGFFGGNGSGPDIVFANEGQDVRVYRGIGGGAFGAPVIVSTVSPNVSALAVGNVDGDFNNDLVIANDPGPVQLVRFSDGVPMPVEDIGGSDASVRDILLLDLDGDFDLDLLVATDGPDKLYLNDGTGGFVLAGTDEFVGSSATTTLGESATCPECFTYKADMQGVAEYRRNITDLFLAVIDTSSSTLEFSTYLNAVGSESMFRGLEVGDNGAVRLIGYTDGDAWPVAGTAHDAPAGALDVVFIELDIDMDDDGVLDGSDNCLEAANPEQRDSDGDAYGNFCDPDLNNDGMVNFADLQLFRERFFGADADADLDGDGAVNFTDLQIAKQYFFGSPGPSGLLLP